MDYQDYVKLGLNDENTLKLILSGSVQNNDNDKVGVVSVVYATNDRNLAQQKLIKLTQANPANYYMVYSVPLDTDLTTLNHYPSIAITKEDLI